MIIRIIATALIQCSTLTQAGWMGFAVVGVTCSSLTARLDMMVLCSKVVTGLYAGNRVSVTALQVINSMPAGHGGNKNAGRIGRARYVGGYFWGQHGGRG